MWLIVSFSTYFPVLQSSHSILITVDILISYTWEKSSFQWTEQQWTQQALEISEISQWKRKDLIWIRILAYLIIFYIKDIILKTLFVSAASLTSLRLLPKPLWPLEHWTPRQESKHTFTEPWWLLSWCWSWRWWLWSIVNQLTMMRWLWWCTGTAKALQN